MTEATNEKVENNVDDARPVKEEAEETTETDTQEKPEDEVVEAPTEGAEDATTDGETKDGSEEVTEGDVETTDDKSIIQPDKNDDDSTLVSEVENETPREKALRLELTKTRGALKKQQMGDVKFDQPVFVKKELDPAKKKILEKYKPAEIGALKEVLEVLSEDMGYVKADQLNATQYQQKAGEILDSFLDEHPEYKVKAGKDNPLWNAFTDDFKMYRQTNDPRDLKKIFNRIHQNVMGVKPSGGLNKVKAAQQKIKVASHAGAPGTAARTSIKNGQRIAPQHGLRTDMLKGFSPEDIAEIESGQV